MILRDAIEISCAPERVSLFFADMEAHHLHWHPDHKVFRWTSGRGLAVGNAFYFEELIAGKLLKKNVIFTRIDSHSHIEFAPTFWLMRVFLPRMLFRIEATGPAVCRWWPRFICGWARSRHASTDVNSALSASICASRVSI